MLPALYILVLSAAAFAIVPPRDGGELPDGFKAAKEKNPRAFMPGRGWIVRSRAVMDNRRIALSTGGSSQASLSGTMRIPVIGALYSDFSGQPQSLAELQTELFDGPWPTGTMTEYYLETSAGLFLLTGDVLDWISLVNGEDYYTGYYGQGIVPGLSKTDEMIQESVSGADASVDFGLYDNDGPDGVPNSGDDDGYVDVLIIVHATIGAECNNSYHMWSHSWQYSLWDGEPGGPLETDDPSASGGVILVDDYIVVPSVSCDGGLIEIGVFCHELGHALGLPDLYDGYGSYGIGYWGLMGTGNWNTPEKPAHLCGWSKDQLGWVTVVDIDWIPQQIELQPINQSAEVLRLVTPTKRFRLMIPPSSSTGRALVCGYDENDAGGRRWPGGAGYGNMWNETMSRTFRFNGAGSVILGYDIATDLESDYDFAYVLLENSTRSDIDTLASYTGRNQLAPQTLDISPYLQDEGFAYDYTITFALASDFNYSDEDGWYDSDPASALVVDNISILGGGEDYSTDFEEDVGGWLDTSPPAEYFLIENRTRSGFDVNLPGEGLLIWHAENSTANSELGNSGGSTNTQARGVVLEEADGNYDLLSPSGNPGDSGDPFPGASGNRAFTNFTVPSSLDNAGNPTPVAIMNIGGGSGLFKAGMPAPQIASVDPSLIDKTAGDIFLLDVSGSGFLDGGECFLSKGDQLAEADSVIWLGEERITAGFRVGKLYSGEWDVTVVSGDGQQALLESGLTILSTIVEADVEVGLSYIKPVWLVSPVENLAGSILYRSESGGDFEQLGDTLRSETGGFEYRDESVVPGLLYRYRVKVIHESTEEEYEFSGEYSIEERGFNVISCYPNPFSESTRIVFFTPDRRSVDIRLYDVSGRLVDDLGAVSYGRGTHEVLWAPDPSAVSSGVYFCTISTGSIFSSRKIVLIR
jgi:M6 family metalloprotease-like protein